MGPALTFDRARCLACRSCELACAVAHSRARQLALAVAEEPRPLRRVSIIRTWSGVDALTCQQCDEPLCVFACKSGALHRVPRDWRVALDEERCVGCLMCLMVCPFGIRPDALLDNIARCDACSDSDHPACVHACPTHALRVADDRPSPVEQTPFTGHLVIVGSSAAGVAAAEAAREHAPRCTITVVTADGVPTYSRPLLGYALAGRLPADRLQWRPHGYLEDAIGARVLTGVHATGVDAAGHVLALDNGERIAFDRLVVATGAGSTRPEIPGRHLRGVHVLRDLGDLAALEQPAKEGGRAVVVGGGNVGLQTAEAWLERALPCTLVVRSPHVLSQMVDAAVGERVGRLFRQQGLDIRTGTDVVEILGGDTVEAVRLSTGDLVAADVVIVAKGIRPRVDWLRGSDIHIADGVVVDPSGRTNIADVYAAGDCAEAVDPITGRSAVSGIWPVAYEMGRVAGSTAVGVERMSRGALRANASRFFGVSIISIGEVRDGRLVGAESEVLADTPASYRKVVRRHGRVVGALMYGDVSNAGLYYRLYRDGVDLGDISLRDLEERPPEALLDNLRPHAAAADVISRTCRDS